MNHPDQVQKKDAKHSKDDLEFLALMQKEGYKFFCTNDKVRRRVSEKISLIFFKGDGFEKVSKSDKKYESKRPEHGFVFYKYKDFRPGRFGFDKTGSYGCRAPFYIHFFSRHDPEVEFCVLSAHLDPSKSADSSRTYAAKSAAFFLASSHVPTFFLGDFNLYKKERGPFYELLAECDSCQVIMDFQSTTEKGQSFDDIVFQREFVSLVANSARVVAQVNGQDESRPSDHDPLVATFILKPTTKTSYVCDLQRWNLTQMDNGGGTFLGRV